MNIFILSKDPKKCAQMHCDTHCSKMILESAQLICTAKRVLDGVKTMVLVWTDNGCKSKEVYILPTDNVDYSTKPYPTLFEKDIYYSTHINHPCTKWVMKSYSNFIWLKQLAYHLNEEYKYRFNHTDNHKSMEVLEGLDIDNLSDFGLTKPALAMDDEYKITSGFNVSQTKTIIKRKESVLLVIKSYRNYYAKAKANLLTYTKRNKPKWLEKF